MKPGYRSTEFWLALGTMVGSIASMAMTGDASPDSSLSKHIAQAFVGLGSIVMAIVYIAARTWMKAPPLDSDERKPSGSSMPPLPMVLMPIAALLLLASSVAAIERSTFVPAPASKACWGRRNQPAPAPQPPASDPALIAALNQLVNQNQQLIALLSRPAPAPAAPISSPVPMSTAPHILLLPSPGGPGLYIPPGGAPPITIPPGGAAPITIPPGGAPPIVIPPGGRPPIVLPPGGGPPIVIPPGGPVNGLPGGGGGAPPIVIPPGGIAPAAPVGYQTYAVWHSRSRVWIVVVVPTTFTRALARKR